MDTDLLAQLIDRKHDVLLHLRQLARRQQSTIDEQDMSGLMSLLAEKQRLLTLLQTVETQLNPFRKQDPERRVWRSADDRARCAEISAQCAELLQEVMQLERAGEFQLTARRDDAARRLQTTNHAGEACQAYSDAPGYSSSSGYQLDLSSGE